MRLMGILLMAVSLFGVGTLLAERGKERLLLLIELRQMIYYLKSQMLYSNAPLPEAVWEVGNHFRSAEPENEWDPSYFFLNVGKRLGAKGSRTFSEVWKEEVATIPSDVPLTKSDRQNLSALGGKLGYADRSMQERTLLFYLEQLDETTERVKAEAESLGKLYRTLGVAAGMFWFVLLV